MASARDSKLQEENSTGESQFTFNDLPIEIISYIFEYVPYPYFVDIRLVCRMWYNIATDNYYCLDHEKVVCVRDFGDPATWMKSSRYFLHLSLEGEEKTSENASYWTDWSDLYDENFWIRFGNRLRSLSIRMCQIDYGKFISILLHCPHLRALEIIDCKLIFRLADIKPLKLDFLDRLNITYKDVIRGRDNQNSGSHEYQDLNGQLFNQIALNAPNLKSLQLKNCMNDRKGGYLTSQHVLDFVRKNCKRIRDLSLKCDENVDRQTLIKLLTIPGVKLRSLETNFPFPRSLIDRLESIETLDIDHHVDESAEIRVICDRLKHLKRLKLRCETYAVSGILLLQNLVSLDLDIDFIGYDALESMLATSFCCQEDTKLKHLSLKCFCSPVILVKIARRHPALTHLSLNCHSAVTDWSVQAIFKYLVRLETLELADCEDISDAGFAGQKMNDFHILEENPTGHSIGRLKKLSELNLRYFLKFRGTSFDNGVVLPELRHIRLHRSPTSASTIRAVIKNHPRIETLDCKCDDMTDELVDEIIQRLPCLRYFDGRNPSGISLESHEKLSRHCRTYITSRQSRDLMQNIPI